jgi:hypothetical protein
MSNPEVEQPITNEILIDFVVKNIGLTLPQKELLGKLVNDYPEFRSRVANIYRIKTTDTAEDVKSGGLLLEQLKSDISAISEG